MVMVRKCKKQRSAKIKTPGVQSCVVGCKCDPMFSPNERILVGYILPRKDLKCEDRDSESETEEAEPEFLDVKQMKTESSGGHFIQKSTLQRTEVWMKELMTGLEMPVTGCFALQEPWWKVTCTLQTKRRLSIRGHPSYGLLTEWGDGEHGRSLLALFLKECGVSPDYVVEFIQSLPPGSKPSLLNVHRLLDDFSQRDSRCKLVAGQMKTQLLSSVAGRRVQAALLYPESTRYLPILLPEHFTALLLKGKDPTAPTEVQDEVTEEADTSLLGRLEQMVRDNVWKLGFTFILYKELRLIGCEASLKAFKDCRLFWKIPPLQRDALEVYEKLKNHGRRSGSTYMELEKLKKSMKMSEVGLRKAVLFLKEEGVVIQEEDMVVLRHFYNYETGIAECLRALIVKEPWKIEIDVKKVLSRARKDVPGEEQAEMELDPDQVRAAEMICANPVTVISGKGGCGKTTVVSLVFQEAKQMQHTLDMEEVESAIRDFEGDTGGSQDWNVPAGPPGQATQNSVESVEILLTAPTGRAASLLTKRTKFKAFTLHQVWWSYRSAKKNSGVPLNWKFSSVRVLVVDEGSLVSVRLLHSVLTMLTKYAQLQKLILLGDVRQLPSIEPGNTLADMFHSLLKFQWATEMRTNHRAESELIVKNSGLISDMGERQYYCPLQFDAIVNLMFSPIMPTEGMRFILVLLPDVESMSFSMQDAILKLLKEGPGLNDHKTSQFIAFKRDDCDLINELCCKHYSNHTTRNHRKKLKFQPDDKVCCTRNGNVLTREAEEELERRNRRGDGDEEDYKLTKRQRLCNGEIFFIKHDQTEDKRYLTLDDCDGRELTVSYKQLQKECRLKHAWARTIHTFQGSEAETIVYVLGCSLMQTWRHVYTAVTRGRKRVYVVASQEHLQTTIRRWEIPRKTRLGRLVEEAVTHTQRQRSTGQGATPAATPNTPDCDTRDMRQPPMDQSPPRGKRTGCYHDDGGTPSKQQKVAHNTESPLNCSSLQSLTLHSPRPGRKQLFPGTTPQTEEDEGEELGEDGEDEEEMGDEDGEDMVQEE